MEEEIWKDVPGWEGHYQVSNFGRVKSVKRIIHHFMRPRPHVGIRDGRRRIRYMVLDLRRPGVKRKIFLHVLIAQLFLPNPGNLPIVNHRDRNTFNFALTNLEWMTPEENQRHWRGPRKVNS